MSRGLGTAQHLILKALASLEAEHGQGGQFYVWAIVDRAYSLSPQMQARERAADEASAERAASIRERAAQGDERAATLLMLTLRLGRSRRGPRARRTTPFWLTETTLNPSRVLAGLARRGLVTRTPIKGGGAAGLTDAGRSVAAGLSVGTSCAETQGLAERPAQEVAHV